MIEATVKSRDYFAQFTKNVEKVARLSANKAADTAAATAQASASIDLELSVIHATAVGSAIVAGIKAHAETSDPRRTTPIAIFFDKGTLGKRRTKLRQPGRREESWQVNRDNAQPYTATRRSTAGGIPAERFFLKARAAGRAALIAEVERQARFGFVR